MDNLAVIGTVDLVTRARAGSLSAHGLSDQQISDVLLLSLEQVVACRNSDEFKKKYAEVADEQIQRQIDLSQGWDAIEEKSLAQILETLEYNRDPKYALFAAKTANSAQRRSRNSELKVIDGAKVTNNTIVLNLNKTFVNAAANPEHTAAVIDIKAKQLTDDGPRQRRDLPSPQHVENLLAPVRKVEKDKLLTELEDQFERAGVFLEEFGEQEQK